MSAPSYPIDIRPCIPVRTSSGEHQAVGLRTLLRDAHQIEDLAVPVPPAASALLRFLTAVTARITGLDDPDMPLEEWHQRRNWLLREGKGFSETAIHAYFDRYVFDLFHPVQPWLQDPSLTHQCTKSAGVNALVYGRPAGNNLAWLSPHADTDPQPVPCDEALWHLLIHHYYGAAGRCSARTIGPVTSGNGTAGPLRATISFHPLGATLFETLLLHLVPYRGDGQILPDTCPWERDRPPDPLDTPPPVTWPGGLLTGRSRHALLLIPTPDGNAVTDSYLTWATQSDKLPATDPYVIIETDPDKPADRRDSARRADAARATWRDLDALLLAGDETATVRRPLVFDTLNDLPEPTRSRLRVQVHGFDQDGKTKNRTWYTALTPPIWNFAQERDPAMAQRITECRAAAEHVGAVLARAATTAWRHTTTPRRDEGRPEQTGRTKHHGPSLWAATALAAYWPRAQTAFEKLIDHRHHQQPARPAFVREAIDVLRQVTAPALTQHRQAAPALAQAVVTLRAAATSTRTKPEKKGRPHAQP